jgi:hypothetical protein
MTSTREVLLGESPNTSFTAEDTVARSVVDGKEQLDAQRPKEGKLLKLLSALRLRGH